MLFSIVVPIYNIELYLEKCIKSILQQTFTDFELILVDDGSKDNCSRICDEYEKKDSRIKVIHKENGGLVSARQSGTLICKGDYIVPVDGDDWLDENCLMEVYNIISQTHPDVVCWGYVIDTNGETKNCPISEDSGFYTKDKIIEQIYPHLVEDKNGEYFSPSVWGKAYRKDLYTKVQLKLDQGIKIAEDQACTRPIICNCENLYIMNQCLYYYRNNPSSMTKSKTVFNIWGPKLVGQCLESLMPVAECDFQEQINRHVVHTLFVAVLTQFNAQKDYKEIKKNISVALDDEYYQKCIADCKYNFKAMKQRFAKYCLRNRRYYLMFLSSRFY